MVLDKQVCYFEVSWASFSGAKLHVDSLPHLAVFHAFVFLYTAHQHQQ